VRAASGVLDNAADASLPPIRYAQTADGARIAFQAFGRGPACLVLFAYHASHLRLNWRVALHRRGMQLLAEHFTVVTLDLRGAGLSKRHVESLSLECFRSDIEAVLAALGIDRVAICAMGPSAPIACHFAVEAPDRVTRMVFVHGGTSEANRRLLALRSSSRDVEARLRGLAVGGVDDLENAAALAAVARDAIDPSTLAHWERLFAAADVEALAAGVTVPTLCLHAVNDDLIPLAAGQALVAKMPKAQLMTVQASHPMQIWRDPDAVDAMTRWLAEGFGLDLTLQRRARRRSQPGSTTNDVGLTRREIEVLRLLAAGKTNRQIAGTLFISLNTVSHHVRNIFAKTRSANRTEAAAFAHKNRP
jgi:DNA-binding CsgD family transcriptional regulator/pimeloyl-ACP methyl ester carboxylesterase